MKNKKMIFGLLTFALLFSMASVSACSCVIPGTPNEELNNSYSVFSGKVIDMKKNAFDLTYDVTFEVQDIWKGPLQGRTIVKTGQDSAMCGYPFEINKIYLVYTHEYEGEINANLCGRTTLLENADQDLQELGSPQDSFPIGTPEYDLAPVERKSFFESIRAWFSKIFGR